MPERAVPVTFRRATRLSIRRDQLLHLLEIVLEPLVLVVPLWAVALAIEGHLGRHNMILSLIVFSLTFPGPSRLTMSPWRLLRHIALGWLAISGLLLLFGYGSRYLEYFDRDVLLTWWWVAPLSLTVAHFLLRAAAPAIREFQGHPRRVVLAGKNAQGIELAQRLIADPYSNVHVVDFFDDREQERLDQGNECSLLGTLVESPDMPGRTASI